VKTNLGKLFKDKRVQLGAAAAAVLGLVVLLKKGPAAADTTTAGSGSTNTGTLDSTGTDSYNAIGQLGQAWQDEWNTAFQGFSGQLTDINTKLGALPQPGSTTPNVPAKIPPINPKLKAGTGWRFVKPGETVASAAKRFGVSEAMIRSLNTPNNLNRFSPGETIRIRYAAGPKTGK
jgi:hypothetical protein